MTSRHELCFWTEDEALRRRTGEFRVVVVFECPGDGARSPFAFWADLVKAFSPWQGRSFLACFCRETDAGMSACVVWDPPGDVALSAVKVALAPFSVHRGAFWTVPLFFVSDDDWSLALQQVVTPAEWACFRYPSSTCRVMRGRAGVFRVLEALRGLWCRDVCLVDTDLFSGSAAMARAVQEESCLREDEERECEESGLVCSAGLAPLSYT
jgi:hypothetical protein